MRRKYFIFSLLMTRFFFVMLLRIMPLIYVGNLYGLNPFWVENKPSKSLFIPVDWVDNMEKLASKIG